MKITLIYLIFIVMLNFALIIPDYAFAELVGAWLFDEDNGDIARDSSGKGHDGIIKGCEMDEGKYNKGLRFAAGNALEIPDHPDFDFGDKITIALWANIESLPNDHIGLPGKGHDLPVGSFVFHPTKLDQNKYELRFYISIGAQWPMSKSADTANFGEWHHLAGTYNGSELKVFIDGELSGTLQQKGKMNTTEGAPLKFTNDCCGRQLVGVLDEIQIYNDPLPDAEIKRKMEQFSLAVQPDASMTITWGAIKSRI